MAHIVDEIPWKVGEVIVKALLRADFTRKIATRWAILRGLTSNWRFQGDEQVLDFGMGDGKLSALISFMVPQGHVTGVDISKEMVSFASKRFPYKNLTFFQANSVDFENAPFAKKFDLITSFCVFHLVPNPEKVLAQLKSHMHPQSKLLITFPIGENIPFFQAVSAAMASRNWHFPSATEGTVAMRDPTKARQTLESLGFHLEHFQVIDTRTPFSTRKELIDWFEGTLSANWDIPLTGRRDFFEEVATRYFTLRPEEQDPDGFVYFSVKRVEIVASIK